MGVLGKKKPKKTVYYKMYPNCKVATKLEIHISVKFIYTFICNS